MNVQVRNDESTQLRNASSIFCWCSSRVLGFLSFLFAFTLGLIIGALFAAVFLAALPTLITAAVLLAIMIITILIFRACNCCENRRCNN